MTSKQNYENIIGHLRNAGFEKSIGVNDLNNAIREEFTIYQNSHLRFHIKGMEEMGLIKLTVPGVWEIVSNVADNSE